MIPGEETITRGMTRLEARGSMHRARRNATEQRHGRRSSRHQTAENPSVDTHNGSVNLAPFGSGSENNGNPFLPSALANRFQRRSSFPSSRPSSSRSLTSAHLPLLPYPSLLSAPSSISSTQYPPRLDPVSSNNAVPRVVPMLPKDARLRRTEKMYAHPSIPIGLVK
ncbi:hypothetical protein KM043_000756 [Ampulex compressa]|nr:hypothetical protein KM043_000756 [Ampulex compressa]